MIKPLMVGIAALTLLGSAIACTDDKKPSTSVTAETSAPQAQTAGFQAPSKSDSASASLNDGSSPTQVVKAIRPSVVRVRAGGQQTGAFGSVSRGEGTGTGFIIDVRGYLVTNNHVVTLGTNQEASNLQIDLWDGRTVQGKLVGRDERTDLAVIKIEADKLTALRFADPSKVEVGDEVLAIGFALDLGATPTVTKGVISAKDRVIDETLTAGGRQYPVSISGAVQTDAAINPGNSGGPLVNMRGEVVGINTAGLFGAAGQPVQGIFFAVASGIAEPIVRALLESGRVERGFLGVELRTIDRDVARAQNLKVNEGAGLNSVTSGSPAEKGGLRAGDVITKINDLEVKNAGDVANALARFRPGQTVKVHYARGSQTGTADVQLGDRPAGQP